MRNKYWNWISRHIISSGKYPTKFEFLIGILTLGLIVMNFNAMINISVLMALSPLWITALIVLIPGIIIEIMIYLIKKLNLVRIE